MTVTRSFCSAVYAAPDTGLVHEEVFWPYSRLEIRQGSVSYILGRNMHRVLSVFAVFRIRTALWFLGKKNFGSLQPIHAAKVNFFSELNFYLKKKNLQIIFFFKN